MFQKLQAILKKHRHDKKGQSVIELGIGLMLTAVLLTVMFDFALIIQTKTETMMIARNATRWMLLQGINQTNPNINASIANQAKTYMRKLYTYNHSTTASQKVVSWSDSDSKVINTPGTPNPIKNSNAGKNPVYAQACEIVHPMTISVFKKSSIKICSSYTGSHSSQYKQKQS